MKRVLIIILSIVLQMPLLLAQKRSSEQEKSVYVDKKGVIRWADGSELALFGANYSLPSACDYRAAGLIGADRKKMVDDDMAHFARMGWDGMRLCLWGDYENSDKYGNLLVNDHLDLLDYAIFKAKERGIHILLTPITTYSSQWPDAMGDTVSARGFSTYYKKSELGTNPEAIKVQVNYLQQVMNHVNTYTGIPLKEEPAIVFVELINEPIHHPEDFQGSVRYINALADAVKSTGCNKLLFYNVSQDMNIAKAVKASKVDGASFAWYPMGLTAGHMHTENHLRSVDDFTPMHTTDLTGMPRIVYEFDEADGCSPYMYPAMTRSFRNVGAQFASMFSYDMLATAPYNLGWQTHVFNMVYTPQKAAAGIIAAEEMKQLPLYKDFGPYPANTTFGPVSIRYETNGCELITKEKFLYSNSTKAKPLDLKQLKKVVGYGCSPIVGYPGKGLYFLDKVENGVWRLEVYPDAHFLSDPFAQMSKNKVVSRLISREWPMSIDLSDLGKQFTVSAVNLGNRYCTTSTTGSFTIRPGVYVLSANGKNVPLPKKIGAVLFDEFVCPESFKLPAQVQINAPGTFEKGNEICITAEVVDFTAPDEVALFVRTARQKKGYRKVTMKPTVGYTYTATISTDQMQEGVYVYDIAVTSNGVTKIYPSLIPGTPTDWDFYATEHWSFNLVNIGTDILLLDPDKDFDQISYTRIGDGGRTGDYNVLAAADQGRTAIRMNFPIMANPTMQDYSMSIPVKKKILERSERIKDAHSIALRMRGNCQGQKVFLTIMEADGTSWSKELQLDKDWKTLNIPFLSLHSGKGMLIPQGYPCEWNYWVYSASGRGGVEDRLQPDKIERIQLSFRPSGLVVKEGNPWLEISAVNITFP